MRMRRLVLRGSRLKLLVALAVVLIVASLSAANAASPTVTWSNQTPTPNATVPSFSQTISVRATGVNDLVRSSAKLWMDGSPYTVTTTVVNSKTLDFRATDGVLNDGVHTVRTEITDTLGTVNDTQWSYTVAAAPRTQSPVPASGATVTQGRPAIGCDVWDNTGGNLTVRLTVDGQVKFNGSISQLADRAQYTPFRWTPPADLANNANHTASVLVTDGVGLTTTRSWTFRVQALPPMYPNTSCGGCHTTYPAAHPVSNCTACHGVGTDVDGNHNIVGTSPSAAGPCLGCHDPHDSHTPYLAAHECTECHASAYPTIPRHAEATIDTAHITTTTGCTDCHASGLITEHAKYPTGSEFKYECSICHSTSARADVKAAVTAGNTNCPACHAGAGHVAEHVNGTPSATCEDCHNSNLSLEHSENCSLCHDSADPRVVAAIEAGGATCGSCHDLAGGHEALHVGGLGGEAACAGCHNDNLALEHGSDCALCHESSDPKVQGAIDAGGAECTDCHGAIHGGLSSDSYNSNYLGYLSWTYAVDTFGAEAGTSPHGNYATTTNKCAVCHAAHRAVKGGAVLTAINDRNLYTTDPSGVGSSSPNGYTKGCGFCHGQTPTFSTKQIGMGSDGSISPHGNCSRCHIESPHGAGASTYPVLTALLLNTRPDSAIGADIAGNRNGLAGNMFDGTSPALVETGQTLGTGYLCNTCHDDGGGGIDLAFPVNQAGAAPSIGRDGTAEVSTSTGHRVTAVVTTDWNQTIPGGDYNAYYTGGGEPGATSQIAWAPANSCQTCHDARKADGTYAFPHGYVDSAGSYATKTTAGASLVWLTTSEDADDSRTILPAQPGGTTSGNQNANNDALTGDGLCLKCHVSGDRSAGVGKTY